VASSLTAILLALGHTTVAGTNAPRKRLRKTKVKEEEEAQAGDKAVKPSKVQHAEEEAALKQEEAEDAMVEQPKTEDQAVRGGMEEPQLNGDDDDEGEAEEEVDSDFEGAAEEQQAVAKPALVNKAVAKKGKTVKGKSKYAWSLSFAQPLGFTSPHSRMVRAYREATKGMLALLSSSIDYDPVASAIWKKGEK
jgi:hypothetical protein